MTFDKYKFYGELQTMQHKVTNHLADMAYTKPTFLLIHQVIILVEVFGVV